VSAINRKNAASFFVAVGAVGVTGVFARMCPAGCASCTTCWSALLPAGTAVASLGLAVAGSAAIRAGDAYRAKEQESQVPPRDET